MIEGFVIDPGHGGIDNGGGSCEYFKEKEINLLISKYQYKRLIELNIPCILTRKDDTYLSPS